MNTIMNTAEFIRVTDLLKKEKIAKNSGNIFAAMMAMRENRPEAICADGFKMSIQASEDHYCQKGNDGSYVSVEVGFPSPSEPLLDEYGDDGVYGYGFTGCYDCKMRRKNAISKPECFVVRLMLAFAGENGIANPFSDVRSILGENSLLGLDFVDHIQKLCGEYNGVAWHGDDEHVVRDRFKFEAAHKAGYTMIRIQEPGLEVLDPKYDIVMPEGFCRNHKYDAKIMEEVGRKVIHLLEEIYGRKASPEIWALNNFKEFEVWYDTNKKELEANARKKGPKGKTAAKKAA